MDVQNNGTIVVDGRENRVDCVGITADEVLRLGGVIGEGIVVRIDGGRPALFAPGASLDIEASDRPVFKTFRGANLYHLRVEGALWDWGGPAISEDEIREIADVAENETVAAASGGSTLRRGAIVDLTIQWPPEFKVARSRNLAVAAAVPVVINGRSLMLERDEVTFEDLVGIAFPGSNPDSPGMRSLTVSYRRGPLARPEGSLISQQTTQLTKGQIFNVTATDKS
jgi:hypothetical protein